MSLCKRKVCRDVEFRECDETTKKVTAILKCELFVPEFDDCDIYSDGGDYESDGSSDASSDRKWKHGDYGDHKWKHGKLNRKFCVRLKGFKKCDQFVKKVPAFVKCKILAPEFEKKKKCY